MTILHHKERALLRMNPTQKKAEKRDRGKLSPIVSFEPLDPAVHETLPDFPCFLEIFSYFSVYEPIKFLINFDLGFRSLKTTKISGRFTNLRSGELLHTLSIFSPWP